MVQTLSSPDVPSLQRKGVLFLNVIRKIGCNSWAFEALLLVWKVPNGAQAQCQRAIEL